jgi:hypothetical protein
MSLRKFSCLSTRVVTPQKLQLTHEHVFTVGNKDEANGMNRSLDIVPTAASGVRPVQLWTHLHTQYHVLCKPDDCQ